MRNRSNRCLTTITTEVEALAWAEGNNTLAHLGAARDLWPQGWRRAALYYFDTIGSTNDEAARLAAAGEPEGTAVVAQTQTSGRGRRGRSWSSPAGGLWISVVVSCEKLEPQGLSLAAGVAAAKAVEGCCGKACQIKWPNDLIVEARKVGGILIERAAGRSLLIVGIGVNCNQHPDSFDAALRTSATTLQESGGRGVPLPLLTGRLMFELERCVRLLRCGGWSEMLSEWRARDALAGRRVRVKRGEQVVVGTCLGVLQSGEMLLREGNRQHRIPCLDEVEILGSEGVEHQAG